MKKYFHILLLIFSVTACSSGNSVGGTEFGNPTRELTGTVVTDTPALVKSQTVSCEADSVVLTNASGGTVSANLDTDCSFTLDVPIDKSYLLSFISGGSFIANMIFSRDSLNTETTIFFVSSGSGIIDLGDITINGSRAIPAINPLSLNDRDGNGISDFDDNDDDGDGIDDDSEEDCDFDGFWDDDDACTSDDGDSGDSGSPTGDIVDILQVYPFDEDVFIDLDEDIFLKADCEIDEDTLTASVQVLSEMNDEIMCEWSLENSDTRAKCEHSQEFGELTVYVVGVDGLMCLNGDTIESISWSFETGVLD